MRARYLLAAAAGALVATVLAGGIAWAGIPGPDGAIHGCYQKNEGQLRLLDPDTDGCRPSEIGVTWSQEGPQGDRGDPGDPGAPGRDGVDGNDGAGVTVRPEPPGANCSTGGLKVTDAVNGVAYVCAPPDPGEDD